MKATATAGRQTKGSSQATRAILKPVVHQDTWFLRISQPPPTVSPNSPPVVRWERRKKPTNSPNPPRAGATMTFHKSRGIAFGGVHDVEESEEGIDSEFFDVLYAWNIDRNRFFPLTLRRPRGPSKKQSQAERGARRGRGKADEEELLRNLAALETKGTIQDADAMELDAPESISQEPAIEQPVLCTMPHPRFNAQLAVQDDVLYLFGGTYEHGDREYTFDEMYSIDLGKLDGVKQIFHREVENWLASDEEDESQEEDGMSEDAGTEEDELEVVPVPKDGTESAMEAHFEAPSESTTLVEEEQDVSPVDSRPHPRPFETLRDFYARTSPEWQELVIQESRDEEAGVSDSVKELKKKAFGFAEDKWWDCREEIMALEDQQEEAGIGEVVNIHEKEDAAAASKPGRRR